MLSIRFLFRILTLPVCLVKTTIQYYTVGTIYSTTNREFNSLFKNIQLAAECHLANNFSLSDIPIVVYKPLPKLLNSFKSNPMVSKGQLNHFGEKFTDNSYWITKNEGASNVLIYLHGGGFALNCFDAQLAGFIMLYHALPKEVQKKYSFLVLDYSLSFQPEGKFPTQIYQTLQVYSKLVTEEKVKVHLLGDSAGGNLAIAVSKFLSKSEDNKYFDKFPEYDFKQFQTILVQPESCILISPWVQPLHYNTNVTNVDNTGDLGARSPEMGFWYIDGITNDEELANWISFSKLDASKYKGIEYLKTGKSMMIYGEREVLRDGMEIFSDKINSVWGL